MNEIIFLGDSLTAGGDWETFFPGHTIHNYGVGGDTSADVLKRLPTLYKQQPEKIFLMIGINDLGNQVPAQKVIENISIILSRFRRHFPDTAIYVLGLLPIASQLWSQIDLSPGKLSDLNTQIKNVAEDNKASFINISPGFADEEGSLKDSLTNDGLHLNPSGYEEWANRIRDFVTKNETS